MDIFTPYSHTEEVQPKEIEMGTAPPDVQAELAELQDTLATDQTLSQFEQATIQQDIASCQAEIAAAEQVPAATDTAVDIGKS